MTMDVKRLVCFVNFGTNVNVTVKKNRKYMVLVHLYLPYKVCDFYKNQKY